MRTDKDIRREVIAELCWKPSLCSQEIGVAVKDGVVTLSGEVANYVMKYDAEHAAERIRGVKGVALDLEVKMPESSLPSDTEIAHAAVDALKEDAQVPDEIKVRVEDGQIILEGDVESRNELQAAERAVRSLAGVKSVHSIVSVKPKEVT